MLILKNIKTGKYFQLMQDDTADVANATKFHPSRREQAEDIIKRRSEACLGQYEIIALN